MLVFFSLSLSLAPLASKLGLKSPWASTAATSCAGCPSHLQLHSLGTCWHRGGISVLSPSMSRHDGFIVEVLFFVFFLQQ